MDILVRFLGGDVDAQEPGVVASYLVPMEYDNEARPEHVVGTDRVPGNENHAPEDCGAVAEDVPVNAYSNFGKDNLFGDDFHPSNRAIGWALIYAFAPSVVIVVGFCVWWWVR